MPALKPRSGATRSRKSTRKLPRKTLKLKGPRKAAIGPKKVRAKPQRRMPAKTKRVALRKVGGSLMAAIPADVVKRMRFSAGHYLLVSSDDERLILEPAATKPKRYTLRQILASCNFDLAKTDEELEWEAAPRVGREAL
jgi:antitoxin ChpS